MNNKRAKWESSIESDVRAAMGARSEEATITPLECPLVWARESNAFDCVSDADPTVIRTVLIKSVHSLLFSPSSRTRMPALAPTTPTPSLWYVRPYALCLTDDLSLLPILDRSSVGETRISFGGLVERHLRRCYQPPVIAENVTLSKPM